MATILIIDDKENILRVLKVILEKEGYSVQTATGGQQQRVALTRSIINKPSVLLFDEPLSNLNAKLRDQMRLEIRRIQQSFGITSIYVTHDQAEAMTVSDRIVVMNEGRIMQIGTPFKIYSRPANRFVADFIGKVNFIEGRIEGQEESGFRVSYVKNSKVVSSSAGDFQAGGQVLTIVRPESLRLKKAAGADSSFFTGKIFKTVYLGPTAEYEIKVEGREQLILAVTYNPVEEGFSGWGIR